MSADYDDIPMLYTRNQYPNSNSQQNNLMDFFLSILNSSISMAFNRHIWGGYNPVKTIQHNNIAQKIYQTINNSTIIELEISWI